MTGFNQKVIAIISHDPKLKELEEKYSKIIKEGNLTLEMHQKMLQNKEKEIRENMQSVEEEVAKYLIDKKVLDDEISETRHVIIESEEDAIKLCTHNGTGHNPFKNMFPAS